MYTHMHMYVLCMKHSSADLGARYNSVSRTISTHSGAQSIENTNATNAKNNANNEFNSAKENKSKAEQDVIEKKKLCSTACK